MNAAKRKRVRQIVAAFQKYVATYSDQAHYDEYTDRILIDDFLYGIGLALDPEQYRMADGYERFKAVLRVHLDPPEVSPETPSTASTSTEVQP
jgi:disulfide oxidoreductase YuzD